MPRRRATTSRWRTPQRATWTAPQRWFRRAGDTAEAHYNYGVTLMGRREYAQAADAFRKALEVDPRHAQAAVRVRQAEAAAAAESERP